MNIEPPNPTSASLTDWLAYLECLHPKTIELGLERVNRVKERMRLAPGFPLILVGGTNGKGSTCAMLERILIEAGYHVGCYTSPHLLRYNERVRIQGREAGDAELCRAFAEVEAARGDIPLTYFEFGTLAAVWHFVQVGLDAAILEIGLGGRLDAVNAFEPACSVITSIDLDHESYLGNTRESIGFEKAGIYRAGKPALCGDPEPPSSVIDSAQRVGADYRQIDIDFGYETHAGGWDYWDRSVRIADLPLPALNGDFQLGNAACALGLLQAVRDRLPVTAQQIREGLAGVVLPGRFQMLPTKPQIVLDVAHNPHAARALAGNLRRSRTAGRTLAVFGMLSDKDIAGVLHAVAGEIDAWFIAGIDNVRGTTAEELGRIVRDRVPGARIETAASLPDALELACRSAGENDRIIVFGSFYTVADVLRALPTTGTGLYGC